MFLIDSQESIKNLSDEELFAKSQKQPSLFGEILTRYQDAFMRRAMRIVRSEEESEDVVSEAFSKIYRKADLFAARGSGSFKSWAYTVLINTALTHHQKTKRAREVELSEEMEDVLPDLKALASREQRDLGDYIVSVMDRMPEHLSSVLSRFFLEGKSQQEIADEDGISVGAVKTRIYRAKEAFRKINVTVGPKSI